MGVVEIAGTEATLAAPDPNNFGGDIRVIKSGADGLGRRSRSPASKAAGASAPSTWPARFAVASSIGPAARLGLHVLDAMLATADSIERQEFVTIDSRCPAVPLLPDGWDPTERTL